MNQVKAGAILNYAIIALNTIVGLAYTPYMLRCLGQNEYGLYSLVASIIAYLTLLDFGFGNAIIRYTAKFRAEGKRQEQWEMFGMFLIVYAIIGFIAFLGGLCLYFNVDLLFDRTMTIDDLVQARIMMLLLTINLTFTFPLSIFGSIITAYENFVFQRTISILRIILSTVVLIFVLSIGYKAVSLVIVQTTFNIITLIINYLYCIRKLQIHIKFGRFNWPFIKEISIYSFWIFLNAIMDKIYWGTGQFVLGAISGTTAVAIFSVAILLEQMYMQFSVAIVSVLLPKLTSMVTLNCNNKDISALFIKTGRIQCLIMSLILSGFIIFGQSFISLWAGSEYLESYWISLIFFIALFIPLIQNTGVAILQARNQLKFRSCLYIVISLLSLIFQIILSNQMGVLGCAISIGTALILGQGLVMNVYYAAKQHIAIIDFWKDISKMLFVPIVLTSIGLWISSLFHDPSLLTILLEIVIFTIIYVLLSWFITMNNYERQLLSTILKKLSISYSKQANL